MVKDIVILGSSQMAREVAWLIEEINDDKKTWNLIGFIDNNNMDKMVNDYQVIGDDLWLNNYQKDIYAVCAVGDPFLRKKIVCGIDNRSIIFTNLIAPDVKYSKTIKYGKGCIICSGCILTVNIELGSHVIINPGCTISHDVKMQDYCFVASGVHISGNVDVGECTYIGVGTQTIQGVSIGQNSIVGAGAVVVKDIPSNCVAKGNPARHTLR